MCDLWHTLISFLTEKEERMNRRKSLNDAARIRLAAAGWPSPPPQTVPETTVTQTDSTPSTPTPSTPTATVSTPTGSSTPTEAKDEMKEGLLSAVFERRDRKNLRSQSSRDLKQ